MRRHCQPLLVLNHGRSRPLKRAKLTDRSIHEGDLQRLIHSSPEVLPVEELDSSFAPLLSLGREIATEAGNIDNLLISPEGRITIVETKLWRNPQATREVVAQVLDYAKTLKDWSYDDLENAVQRASGSPLSPGGSLYALVAEHAAGSEPDFTDAVQRTLSRGRFLLLVVGDGIRENIERMVDVLHTTPDLLFTFGLIELQLFEDEAVGGRIVFPQVIARTTEIVRAVVKVEGGGGDKVSISLDESLSASESNRARRLSEEEFFDSLEDDETTQICRRIVDLAAEVGAEPYPGTKNLPIRLPDPGGSGQKFTLFLLSAEGEVFFGWFATQLENNGYPPSIAWDMFARVAALFDNVEVKDTEALTRGLTAAEVGERLEEFMAVITRAVSELRREAERVPV